MHIALVTRTYPPDTGWGGIGSYVFHLAGGLVSHDHRVTVLASFAESPGETKTGQVRVLRWLKPAPSPADECGAEVAEAVETLFQRDGVDVVEFPEHGAEGLLFQKRNPHCAVVVKMHGTNELCREGNAAWWKQPLLRFYRRGTVLAADAQERESARRAHVVVSPSEWLLRECRRRGWRFPAAVAMVRNPFDWGLAFGPAAEPDYHRQSVVWLGRLDRRKGAALLPGIIRRVWQEKADVSFEIIGQSMPRSGGDWRTWVERRLPARGAPLVSFHGGIPYPELPHLMAGHSLAVFASTWENCPYTQLEAMAIGMACVSASGGGARELGTNGVSVLQCARSEKEIAAALLLLVDNSALRRQIGEAARCVIQRDFAPEIIAAQMIEHYRTARTVAATGRTDGVLA
jgi:glycosyltransferase involved in cell wall biosynthesis